VALKAMIDSGKYGKVVAADFSRSTPPPDGKGTHGWFLDEKKSGGCLLDMHIHDADMVRFLFGPPKGADAVTHRRPSGLLDHAQIRYAYPDKVVTASVSWAVSKTLGFEAAFRVMFEGATAVFDTKRAETFMVYPQKGKPFAPKVSARNGYEAEQRYFLDIVRGRPVKPVLTARDARDAVALVTSLV
jgi:predicted dehydrogenase